jgi:hypothetical protein
MCSVELNGHHLGRTAGRPSDLTGFGNATPGAFLQAITITLDRIQVRQGVSDRIDDGANDWVSDVPQSVVNPEPVAARIHQPRLPQVCQVT